MEDERDEINIIHDEGEDISDQGPKMIPNIELTPKERRWVILGALSGALLIGLAFIVGLGSLLLSW